MTYLDELGNQIEEQVPPGLVPCGPTDGLFRLYALLALSKGGGVTAEDVHHAWVAWMQDHDPAHRSLKPFDELDAETQAADEPFVRAIRAVAPGRVATTAPDSGGSESDT